MARAPVNQRDRICRLAGFGRGNPLVWVEDEHFLVHWSKTALAIGRLKALGYGVKNVESFYRRGPLGAQTRLTAFDVTLPEHTPTRRARAIARIKAGMARVKAEGRRLGRPRIAEERVKEIRALLAQGIPLRAISTAVHVGLGTVARIKGNTRDSSQRPSCD
jgi:hypothetical protein